MRAILAWFKRLTGILGKTRRDRELAQELETHVQLHIEDGVQRGLTPAAARRVALMKLGGLEQAKESYRERRGFPSLETAAKDLGYAARALRSDKPFTITAVLTLGLAIGANTAIFSFVNSILLRRLPYPESERLMQVKQYDRNKGVDFDWVSLPNFHDWSEQNHTFEAMAAYRYSMFNLTGLDHPETVLGLRGSIDLFSVLRAQPLLGRAFLREEDQPGSDHVAALSYELWNNVFGQDRDVIGKAVMLNNESYTVVAVMPPDFNFPITIPISSTLPSRKMSLWVPLGMDLATAHRDWNMLGVIGRLKSNATAAAASADMQAIADILERNYPVEDSGVGVRIERLQDQVTGTARGALFAFLGAASLVLLIGCANVANLLIARSVGRHREIAVRAAIGASRSRVVRQLLSESLLLALAGGGLGVLVASGIVRTLHEMAPGSLPRVAEVSFDVRVLEYTFAVSLCTALIFGLVPALVASRADVSAALRASGPGPAVGIGTARLRDAVVIIEVALSVALLAGSGLMFKSFLRLQRVDPGFQSDNVLTAWTVLPITKYSQPAQQAAFYQQVLEHIESLPGVETAGAVDALPLTGIHPGGPFTIERRPSDVDLDAPFAYRCSASPDYFRAMRIQIRRGREFANADRQGAAGVVVINETAARQYWCGDDPIGNRLSFSIGRAPANWLEVVGVVADVRQDGLDAPVLPTIYLPMLQAPGAFAAFVVRTTENQQRGIWPGSWKDQHGLNMVAGIRAAIAAVDKDQPIFTVRTMEDVYRDALARRRFNTIVLSAFAAIALVLAGIGIYGIVAYAVTTRGQEIGIRMALGGRRSHILALVVKRGLGLSVAGSVIGLIAALILARLISSLLFEVKFNDAATLLGTSVILSTIAVLSSLIPAHRATQADPAIVLRSS